MAREGPLFALFPNPWVRGTAAVVIIPLIIAGVVILFFAGLLGIARLLRRRRTAL